MKEKIQANLLHKSSCQQPVVLHFQHKEDIAVIQRLLRELKHVTILSMYDNQIEFVIGQSIEEDAQTANPSQSAREKIFLENFRKRTPPKRENALMSVAKRQGIGVEIVNASNCEKIDNYSGILFSWK